MEVALVFIVLFLVAGAVLTSNIYYRSRERGLMIEKGITSEQFFPKKRIGKRKRLYILLRMGIIVSFVGISLYFASFFTPGNDIEAEQGLTLASIIVFLSGIGFILADLVSKKLEEMDEKNSKEND